MCSIAMASMAFTAIGTLSSMSAAQQQGAAQQQAAQSQAAMNNYQAAVARNNQTIAEQNAEYERQKGVVAEQEQRQKTAQMVGTERAGMGAAGVDIGSGSPLRIQGDTAGYGELDALTIRNNAARSSYAYHLQGNDFASQSQLYTQAGSNAVTAGNNAVTAAGINSTASLVTGASSLADKWLKFKTVGAFS